jgi:undecaprenyl-diphosphatase
MSWDWGLFQLINGWAGQWPLVDELMRLLVNDYGLTTAMGLGLVALWLEGRDQASRRSNQETVLMSVVSLVVANILLRSCNLIYFRPRPFHSHPVNILFYYPTDSSLPSNAATVGFSLAMSIWTSNRRAGMAYFLAALLFGLSRVFCGVHFPGDILAGLLLGGGLAYVVSRQRHRLHPLFSFIISIARRLYLA